MHRRNPDAQDEVASGEVERTRESVHEPERTKVMGARVKGFANGVAQNVIATLIVAGILSAAFLGWITGAFASIVTRDASVPAWVLGVSVIAVFGLGGFTGFWINRRREADPCSGRLRSFGVNPRYTRSTPNTSPLR